MRASNPPADGYSYEDVENDVENFLSLAYILPSLGMRTQIAPTQKITG